MAERIHNQGLFISGQGFCAETGQYFGQGRDPYTGETMVSVDHGDGSFVGAIFIDRPDDGLIIWGNSFIRSSSQDF